MNMPLALSTCVPAAFFPDSSSIPVLLREGLHVVEALRCRACWLSVNESEHPSSLSERAGLGFLPHNCRLIQAWTHSKEPLWGRLKSASHFPSVSASESPDQKEGETWHENWTLVQLPDTLWAHKAHENQGRWLHTVSVSSSFSQT